MLKKRDVHEAEVLFELLSHPDVFPFVRQKAYSAEEYMFVTKRTLEEEEKKTTISRTIVDEYHQPIGTINLFDIEDGAGFLGTWIGKPYHGKGYNQPAKDLFFKECFFELGIERIFMKIRKVNERSRAAALKLTYTTCANEMYPHVWQQINPEGPVYDLFVVEKESFLFYLQNQEEEAILEA